MATKFVLNVAFALLFVAASIIMALDSEPKPKVGLDRETLDKIEAAMLDSNIQNDINNPQNRFFWSQLLGTKGNLTAILASAPNNTPSLTFIPVGTLFGLGKK